MIGQSTPLSYDTLLCLLGVGILALPMLVLAEAAAKIQNNGFRFSLRTLLIATTLIALALGAIVWLSTKPPASPPIDHVDLPDF